MLFLQLILFVILVPLLLWAVIKAIWNQNSWFGKAILWFYIVFGLAIISLAAIQKISAKKKIQREDIYG